MMKLRYLLVVFVTVAAGLLFYAASRPSEQNNLGLVKVRVQLQWFDQSQFAGIYVAQARGLYRELGLEVSILAGGYNVNPIGRVRSGGADIGVATADQVLIQAALDTGLRAVGTVFPRSLARFMSLKSKGIAAVSDFRGRTVGYYAGFDTENLLLSMLQEAGIEASQVNLVQAAGLGPFESGAMDVFPAYLINEPIRMLQQGVDVTLLDPDSAGVHFSGDTYFTTRFYAEQQPEALRRFLAATERGWELARENPGAAVSDMYRVVQSLNDVDSAFYHAMAARVVNELRSAESASPLLLTDTARWAQMEGHLHRIGRIPVRGLAEIVVDNQYVRSAPRD